MLFWEVIYSVISSYTKPHHDPMDLSESVVLVTSHYVAIGEHADLWIGDMSNNKVAVKVLRGGSSSNPDFLEKFKERLEKEAYVWRDLKHPNVSEFYGLAFNFGYMPAMILPFYGNGNVVEYVREKKDEAKLDMVKQIAAGLEYLHEKSVVHGDLRGANVLIDSTGSARICDYGLAFIIEPSEFTSVKTAGACRWTAPEIMSPDEVLQDVNEDDSSLLLFTEKSDVYSFGMTMLEIFTGKIPFHLKKNDSSVIFFVLDGGRPALPSFEKEEPILIKLIQDCWAKDPDNRPTSRAVCEILAVHKAVATTSGDGSLKSSWWLRRFVFQAFLRGCRPPPQLRATRTGFFVPLMDNFCSWL